MSYVTGSHAFKYGFNRTHGYLDENQYTLNPVGLRFNNGVPNLITERADVSRHRPTSTTIWASTRRTVGRSTAGRVQGALRFDYFATSVPEQHLGPEPITPNRNITFPAQDIISWKDLTYRSGFAYDIFGNGKTALKVAFNKYLLGQTLNGLGRDPNPIVALPTNATRTWTDRRIRDYVPECDLVNPLANGECAQINNPAFGTAVARPDLFDKDLISGFNHRQANWEFSTSVQHELMPGMALDVGYFRRAWAHFRVTDNLLVEPAGLHPVRHRGAGQSEPAWRRRLYGPRFLRCGAGQVRPGAQPERPLGRLRRSVRELERRGHHGEQPPEERRHAAGRDSAPARRWRTTARSSRSCPR